MKEEKHIRKLRTLLHRVRLHNTIIINQNTMIDEIRKRASEWQSIFNNDYGHLLHPSYKSSRIYIDLINLIDNYNISEDVVETIYNEQLNVFKTFFNNQFINTLKETRDNKTVRVGSGVYHSNYNKIRYPSKKRSVSTWKRFYNLFPEQAKIDNWDGKTSDKMK